MKMLSEFKKDQIRRTSERNGLSNDEAEAMIAREELRLNAPKKEGNNFFKNFDENDESGML